jgi:hypothetical protein
VPRSSWAEATSAIAVVLTVTTSAISMTVVARSQPILTAARRPPEMHSVPSPAPSAVRPPLAAKVAPPPSGHVYWGAFEPRAQRQAERLVQLDRTAGRRPAILMWFRDWSGLPPFPTRAATLLAHFGIVPMVTWEPWQHGPHAHRITLRDIARGRYDSYIRRFALQVRAYGGPLFFRPMHEMDGDWYPWSGTWPGNTPEQFVNAWRHMHRLFVRAGATNATWVWCVNQWSVPHTTGNTIERYWPGSRFVDWIGISGFNAGPVRPPFRWQSFDWVFRTRYDEVLRYGKPMMIAETGAPERGGDKAAWITDTFHTMLAAYPEIHAIVWYDQRDPHHPGLGDWRIDSSPAALQAFRRAILERRVLSAPNAVERTRRRL